MSETKKKIILKWLLVALAVNAILFIISHFAHSWANHHGNWSEEAWYAMTWATGITKGVISFGLFVILVEF